MILNNTFSFNTKKLTYILTASCILFFSSCDKDEDTAPVVEPAATTSAPSSPSPRPSDADAVMIAVNSISITNAPIIGPITTKIGLPIAIFFDGANFKDVGAVTCDNNALVKQPNNSYIFTPSITNPTGITFGTDISWDIAGANGFPAHTKSIRGLFPDNINIQTTTGSTVSSSTDFTLSSLPISGADSVYFGVYGPDGGLNVVLAGNSSSYTFSASEMATIGTGAGFVQIAATKNISNETLGTGEKIYYLTETVQTSSVTLN